MFNKEPGKSEKMKHKSETSEAKRVRTPCGLSMTPEEAAIHSCFHCDQERKDKPVSEYNEENNVDLELAKWRDEK